MGKKAEAGTPKAISNAMKVKGNTVAGCFEMVIYLCSISSLLQSRGRLGHVFIETFARIGVFTTDCKL